MRSSFSPDISTAVVAGGAVAAAVYALAVLAAANGTKLADGKKPRKIHTLDSGWPVLGDLLERVANGERMFDWLHEQSVRFNGEPWMIRMPGQPEMIMFTMPEALEEITITQLDNFPKGQFQLDYLVDLFGEGLVASDGARWNHQRKAGVRFFSAKTLRTLMAKSMQKNMDKAYDVIERKAGGASGLVDLKQLFLEFTIETFAELGLGVDLNCIGAAEPHPFQAALDIAAPITSRRLRVPTWVWKGERWLGIGPEAEMSAQMAIVDSWLDETIQQSLQNITSRRTKGTGDDTSGIKSVVELFVEHGQDGADGLKPEDLKHFLKTFVIGARDTTADTLCWMFYALSKHPEIEQKLRTEMKSKLGDDFIPYLTTDHTKTLTYLEATIKETIRLYPAGPFTFRQANKDTVLCGDVVIRKGQLIGMSAYATARSPFVWGPDAGEFKPERWIDETTGQLLQFPQTKFFSFSAGPRACIGVSLAMLELRVVTANLLHRYTFELDPSNDGTYEVAPTLNMKHPLLARATPVHQ